MAIWDDNFKNAGKKSGFWAGKPNETFKGGFHLELYLGFHFKLDNLYCFYPFESYFLNLKVFVVCCGLL